MSHMLTQIRRAADTEVLTSVPARRVFAVMTMALLTAFSAHVSFPQARGSVAARAAMLAFAGVISTGLVLAGGWAQLSLLTGDAVTALRLGVIPFLIGDVVKLVITVAIALRVRPRTLALL